MNQTSPFLKRGAFTQKKFRAILIAATCAWCVSFVDGCADSLLAGILLSDTAVSAVSLVHPVSGVISFLSYLISVGTVVMFSRKCGAFQKEKGYEYVGQGFICAVAIAVLLVIGMVVVREPLLRFYQASDEITAMARDYYSCEVFFAASFPIYYIIYHLVAFDGDELCSTSASVLSCTVNVAASYLLSFSYGVKGLALGSIFGNLAAILVYSLHFLRKSNSIHLRLHFNIRDLGEVVRIGSSTAMALLYVAFIDIIMNRFVIARFGDAYIPAYTVVNLVLSICGVFYVLADAGSGFIGVAFGEENPASVRQTVKIACRELIIMSLTVMVLLELAAPYLPTLYGIEDPAVRKAAVFAARIIPLACPALAAYCFFCNYYTLVDRVWLSHLISIVYMLAAPLVLVIPLALVFGFNGLSVGFMLTSIAADAVTAVVIIAKYGRKAFPLVLKETNEECIFHEFILTEKNISLLCKKVREELMERGVSKKVVFESQLILEESYMTILAKNKDEKIITECTVLLSDKALRLITRDNGIIFDITDADASVDDLRAYILARLVERNPQRCNTTTISFNRNSFIWQLQE